MKTSTDEAPFQDQDLATSVAPFKYRNLICHDPEMLKNTLDYSGALLLTRMPEKYPFNKVSIRKTAEMDNVGRFAKQILHSTRQDDIARHFWIHQGVGSDCISNAIMYDNTEVMMDPERMTFRSGCNIYHRPAQLIRQVLTSIAFKEIESAKQADILRKISYKAYIIEDLDQWAEMAMVYLKPALNEYDEDEAEEVLALLKSESTKEAFVCLPTMYGEVGTLSHGIQRHTEVGISYFEREVPVRHSVCARLATEKLLHFQALAYATKGIYNGARHLRTYAKSKLLRPADYEECFKEQKINCHNFPKCWMLALRQVCEEQSACCSVDIDNDATGEDGLAQIQTFVAQGYLGGKWDYSERQWVVKDPELSSSQTPQSGFWAKLSTSLRRFFTRSA